MTNVIIVIPCYNEEKRISLDTFKSYSSREEEIRFLFVNDGSTDATGQRLDDLRSFNRNVFQVLHLAKNAGKAEAVRQGFLVALREQPEYIGYWDADLATPLEAIREFCSMLDQSPKLEIVMGSRVMLLGHHIVRDRFRHCVGRLFATLASHAIGIRVYDALCGAKCFRVTERTISIFSHPFHSRWVFDAEWLARFVYLPSLASSTSVEDSIYELPLRNWKEVSGSKLKWYDFISAAIGLARIFLWYRCGFRSQPELVDRKSLLQPQAAEASKKDDSSSPQMAVSDSESSGK